MAGDPHVVPNPAPVPESPAPDTHVVQVGAPLDLESGTVEALLARGPVAGAPISDLTATMTPWNNPSPQREEVDGVETTTGP